MKWKLCRLPQQSLRHTNDNNNNNENNNNNNKGIRLERDGKQQT